MYTHPMISSLPAARTVYVNPERSAKSAACRSRSPRFSAGVMSGVGHDRPSNPGVDRMCAMLEVHAR